jgi:hypothetical protein
MNYSWLAPATTRSAVVIFLMSLAFQPSGSSAPMSADPRIAALLQALEAREQRLQDLRITYDWQNAPVTSGRSTRPSLGGTSQGHVVWARRGRKGLLDETVSWVGSKLRLRSVHIDDGEQILSRYYDLSSDRRKPNEELCDRADIRKQIHGAGDLVGLSYWATSFPDLLRNAASVKFLGYDRVGPDKCLVISLKSRDGNDRITRMWFDIGRGLLLRRAQSSDSGRPAMEVWATEPKAYRPNLFIATRVTERLLYHLPGGLEERRRTVLLRHVALSATPKALFKTTPASTAAFDTRTAGLYRYLPRKISDRELRAMTDQAVALLHHRIHGPRIVLANRTMSTSECGPQCLFVILHISGVSASIDELDRLAGLDERGTSLLGLQRAARAKGFDAQGLRLSFEQLRSLGQPVIGVLPYHFYVIVGFRDDHAVVFSPPSAISIVSSELLRKSWDGRALIVRRAR